MRANLHAIRSEALCREREAAEVEAARLRELEQKQREEEEYQRMKADFAVVEGGSVEDDMASEVLHGICMHFS